MGGAIVIANEPLFFKITWLFFKREKSHLFKWIFFPPNTKCLFLDRIKEHQVLAPLSDEVSKDMCWGCLAELVSVAMFSERGVGGR